MRANQESFATLMESGRVFSVPVFQRNYEWGIEQYETLFKDVFRLVDSYEDKKHYTGQIMYKSHITEDYKTENMIIDGQQRLTTITLLVKAVLDEIKLLEFDGHQDFYDNLWNLLYMNQKGDLQLKLKPIIGNDGVLEKILKNLLIEEKDKNSNVWVNYNYFRVELSKLSCKEEKLKKFYGLGLRKLEVTNLELDKEDDSNQVFESVNSTGLKLSEADLIRNFILMRETNYERQKELYNRTWKQLEKIFPTSKTLNEYLLFMMGYFDNSFMKTNKKNSSFSSNSEWRSDLDETLKISNTYVWFKIWYEIDENRQLVVDNFNIILENAQRYKNIKEGKYFGNVEPFIGAQNSKSPWHFFLVEVIEHLENKNELNKSNIEKIENFIIRRSIGKKFSISTSIESIHKLIKLFRSSIVKTEGYPAADQLNWFIYNLPIEETPSNDKIRKIFINNKIYKKRDVTRKIFEIIEKDNNSYFENFDFKDKQIDHIVAQKSPIWDEIDELDVEDIRDQIGNLTILSPKDNNSMNNKSVVDKLNELKDGDSTSLFLNRDLQKTQSENPIVGIEDIKERSEKLSLQLCNKITEITLKDLSNFDENFINENVLKTN